MKNVLRPLVLATQLGMTMGLMTVSTALAGLLLGAWLDRQFGTRPLATLLFIFVGVLAGLLGTVNLAKSSVRELDAAAAKNVKPRTAYSARDLGRALLLVLQLSLVILVPVGLSLWLGPRLDRAAGSGPLFTILLALVGVLGSLAAVFFLSRRAARRAGHDT